LRAGEPNLALDCVKYLSQAQQAAVAGALNQIIAAKQALKKDPNDKQAQAAIANTYKLFGIADATTNSPAK